MVNSNHQRAESYCWLSKKANLRVVQVASLFTEPRLTKSVRAERSENAPERCYGCDGESSKHI